MILSVNAIEKILFFNFTCLLLAGIPRIVFIGVLSTRAFKKLKKYLSPQDKKASTTLLNNNKLWLFIYPSEMIGNLKKQFASNQAAMRSVITIQKMLYREQVAYITWICFMFIVEASCWFVRKFQLAKLHLPFYPDHINVPSLPRIYQMTDQIIHALRPQFHIGQVSDFLYHMQFLHEFLFLAVLTSSFISAIFIVVLSIHRFILIEKVNVFRALYLQNQLTESH